MKRIVASAWGVAAIVAAFWTASIALGPKGAPSAWVMVLASALAAGYATRRAWQDFTAPGAPKPARRRPTPGHQAVFPGAWRGSTIPLEAQIEALEAAGIALQPGCTLEDLLLSWPRIDYERDPYNLLLFMYGSEVEAEPWGRAFCERVWNFDMECLTGAGDYVRAFRQILRITGQPQLASEMSDTFSFEADDCEIRYTINARRSVLKARVDNDWADPDAVSAFIHDVEAAIGDGRHFWAGENGQASVLLFLTGAEAAQLNALRQALVQPFAGPGSTKQ